MSWTHPGMQVSVGLRSKVNLLRKKTFFFFCVSLPFKFLCLSTFFLEETYKTWIKKVLGSVDSYICRQSVAFRSCQISLGRCSKVMAVYSEYPYATFFFFFLRMLEEITNYVSKTLKMWFLTHKTDFCFLWNLWFQFQVCIASFYILLPLFLLDIIF